MAIPEQFIDELVARTDIADVVGSYVHLTPKGGSLWGCCPFHNEKTPSFHVVPDRQIYKCFGCGKGGGVISFIMEMENLPFVDAVRLLAKRAGMEVPEAGENEAFRQKRARLLALCKDAARFYHSCLKEPWGAQVRDYIAQRRISPRFATRFGARLTVLPQGEHNLMGPGELDQVLALALDFFRLPGENAPR